MEVQNYQENKLQILGKVTASLIHEIRNPLSAIKLSLEYLQMIENELPQDVRDSIKSCGDATDRIQSLIENLSSFTRKNYNGKSTCSINEVTLNAINIMNSSSRGKNVIIYSNLDERLMKVCFDRNKLLQVFLNLIANAIEACENGGNIYIKTYEDDNNIIWEIQDDGIGISEENKQKILHDFYTSKVKGTGLGLSVCQSILIEHQCELKFESSIGNGSRFFVLINPKLVQSNHEI